MDEEDKKLFEAVYLEYQGILRKIACANDVPADYIDDMVQDTFVAFARYKYSLELSPERMKMLLTRILKSRCMDYHRRMRYREYVELEGEEMGEDCPALWSDAPGLAELVISKERCHAIMKELNKMPESWRDIAVLKIIEGRPTKEVCAILNITEKACYSRVSRIRKYFEALLEDEDWP